VSIGPLATVLSQAFRLRFSSEQFAVAHDAFALEEPEGPAWRQGVVGRHQKTNGDYGFAARREFVHPVQGDLATPRQHVSGCGLVAEVEKAPVTGEERTAPSALLGSQQSKARPKLVHSLTVSSNRPSASFLTGSPRSRAGGAEPPQQPHPNRIKRAGSGIGNRYSGSPRLPKGAGLSSDALTWSRARPTSLRLAPADLHQGECG